MKTNTFFLTESDCYRAGKKMRPSGIVVHSTGTNQKRISAYTSQMNKSGVRACVHGFIGLDDDGGLCFVQTLPYDMKSWGCGAGEKGSFNNSHIQLEICEYLPDGQWCEKTYAAALEICAELCDSFGILPENVVCHSEAHKTGYATNHGDVMHWWPKFGLTMDKFREELKDQMLDTEANYQVFKKFMERYEQQLRALPPSDYASDSCRKAVACGLFSDGDSDGCIDAPQAFIRRQELAVILDRKGALM